MKLTGDYLAKPLRDLNDPKIKVEILPDLAAVLQSFARSVADEIKANNEAGRPTRLILPVGPIGQYSVLADICNRERINWSSTHTFNMDEYCDWQGRLIPEEDPLSFRGFMRRKFFDLLDPELRIPPEQAHFPDPLNLDRLSQAIEAVGGIDTCYGGLGYHGHVAFNEPPNTHWQKIAPEDFKNSLTRIVVLAHDTVVMNSIRNTGGNPNNFPPMGVTMGLRDILSSGRIRMYCPGGAWQRHVVRMAIFGDVSVDFPATLLQDHPDYVIIVDEETAKPLTPSLF